MIKSLLVFQITILQIQSQFDEQADTCASLASKLMQNEKAPKEQSLAVDASNSLAYQSLDNLTSDVQYNIIPVDNSSGIYQLSLTFNSLRYFMIQNCVKYQIFQTQNAPDIDPSQVGNLTNQTKKVDNLIYMNINEKQYKIKIIYKFQSNIQGGPCLKFQSDSEIQWQCFYQLNMDIKNVGTFAYFFNFLALLNNDYLQSTVSTSTVQTVQIQQGCDQLQIGTIQQLQCQGDVPTSIKLCQDIACQNPQDTQDYNYVESNVILLKHILNNPNYQILGNYVRMTVQSYEFTHTLDQSEYQIVNNQPAYNIYQVNLTQGLMDMSLTINILIRDLNSNDTQSVSASGRFYHPPPTLQCDSSIHFKYQSQCIPKWCLQDVISRIQLQPLNQAGQSLDNFGNLSQKIGYDVMVYGAPYQTQYIIRIRYGDDPNNQIVAQPKYCVDWRLYQTKNAYFIDSTRMNLNNKIDVPTWPNAKYNFVSQTQMAEIIFSIQQDELDTHNCIKIQSDILIQWQCYFEFAFILKNITQASYYFNFNVILKKSLTAQVPSIDFKSILQVDRCTSSETSNCQVEIEINNTLSFCQDQICLYTSQQPFYSLSVNNPFYMKHALYGIVQPQNWFIQNVTIFYKTFGFDLMLSENDFNIITRTGGYNIYELHVPIAAKDVIISVKGTLSQIDTTQNPPLNKRMLYLSPTFQKTKVAIATQNTGEILAPQSSFSPLQAPLTNKQLRKEPKNNSALLLLYNLMLLILLI